ncbi:hypothetical protein [Paenibacillus sp. FSL H7-0918]|uniref:hypothetical protein n=1 Tax=Paenibacillus sp. FSL H7-0918 TaxID=2921442 RepID=UPI0030F9FB25
MAQQTMYPAIANSPGTELSVALTTAATTIAVVDATKLPAAPNVFTIGTDESSETILYTGKSGNSLTGCTRGFDGTTPKAWAIGSKVARYYTAYDHEAFRKNLTDLSGVTSESTTDVILAAGQQILNATKNARLQGLKVQGRTLIDLLGGAGSGESLTGWAQGAVPATLSTSIKRSGASSFRFAPTNTASCAMTKDFYTPLDANKQYILGAWVYIESTTVSGSSMPVFYLRDVGTSNAKYVASAVNTTVGSWQFVYLKVPTNNTLVGSGFRLFAGYTSAMDAVIYIDEIRLYAVSAADYAAIGTTINNEAIDRLLPYVPPGINGVDGLWVRRYGKNLLPSVPDTLHANAKMNGPYDMTLVATANSQSSLITMPAQPNTVYFISGAFTASTGAATLNIFSVDANGAMTYVAEVNNAVLSRTFNTPASCVALRFNLFGTVAGTFTFKDWFLKIGSTAETFQPREDSLIAFGGVELHANPTDGSEPDILREVNGRYEATKLWREITLSGLQDWTVLSTHTGYKRLRSLGIAPTLSDSSISALVKFDGKVLTQTFSDVPSSAAADVYRTSASGNTTVTVSSTDSGWGDSYTPSADEIKAYFNGYQMGSVSGATFTTPYISGTKAWRFVMGDTSTGTSTLPTTLNPGYAGWQPYQLLYRLANTVIETVQEDGALSLIEGDNFIEVGSGYVSRERANPVMTIVGGSSFYHFNNAEPTVSASKFRYPVQKILGIYEANLPARGVVLKNESVAFGLQDAHIEGINYNLNAPYSASYIKLDKSPVPVVTGFYAATEKMQLHDLTDAVTEISSTVSALAAKKAEKDAPGWIAPTLLNGFTALFSSRVPSYRKVNGVVEFTGALKFTSSTVNANLVIFRLPEGYRPKDQLDFGVLSGSGANRVFGGLEIMPTGEVYVLSGMGGDAIFLDGLPTFRVE